MAFFSHAKLAGWSVRSRILGLTGLLLLLAIMIGSIGLWTTERTVEQLSEIGEREMPVTSAFIDMTLTQMRQIAAFGRARRAGAKMATDPAARGAFEAARNEFERYAQSSEQELTKAEAQLRRLAESSRTTTVRDAFLSLAERTQAIREGSMAHVSYLTHKLQAIEDGQLATAGALGAQAEIQHEAIVQELATVLHELERLIEAHVATARADEKVGRTILLAIALLGIAGGAALSLIIASSVTRPLLRAVKAVDAMAAGDGSATLDSQARDEIGVLCRAVEDFRKKTLEASRAANDALSVANRYRRDAESALEMTRSQEALLSSMSEVAQIGGWELDLKSMRPIWSAQTRIIHEVDDDYQPNIEEAIHFYRPEARDAIQEAVQRGVDRCEGWDLELPMVTAKGREIWVRAVGKPLLQDGVPVKLFGAIQDVTAQRAAREELAAHRDRLQELVDAATADLTAKAEELQQALAKEQELSEMQRQFVATASHEFRTPLAIIDGSVQRILRRKDHISVEELKERGATIRKAVATMTGLMEAALNAARMDGGQSSVEIGAVELPGLISEICERYSELNEDLRLNCDLEKLPDRILADRAALEQVFGNLISNAIKYSPGGADVTVDGWRENEYAVIAVSDRGIGIDEEDIPSMFSRFFRAKTSIGISGTGIGLNLAKTLIELHQGSISVQSEKGEGSKFVVKLLIAGPTEAEEHTVIAA